MTSLPPNATTVQELEYLKDTTKHSLYSGMTPNAGFNIAMIAIWGILLACQCVQVYYRQIWFSVAFICTGILEVLGYIGRAWGHYNVYNMDGFLLNMICLTIAPVFTMGGIYYQLAKLIEVYGHRFSLLPSPMYYSYIFIGSDIVSLAIQAAGGGTAGMAVDDDKSADQGDNIFVAGLAIQVASMFFFLVFWFHFLYRIYLKSRWEHTGKRTFSIKELSKIPQSDLEYLYRDKFHDMRMNPDRWIFRYFTLATTAAVLCVFTRCCYRLAELSEGWGGNLITHEPYFIVLDSIMMTLCVLILTIFHPGFVFLGRHVSIPITKGHVDPEDVIPTEEDLDVSATASDLVEKEKELMENTEKKSVSFMKKCWPFHKNKKSKPDDVETAINP